MDTQLNSKYCSITSRRRHCRKRRVSLRAWQRHRRCHMRTEPSGQNSSRIHRCLLSSWFCGFKVNVWGLYYLRNHFVASVYKSRLLGSLRNCVTGMVIIPLSSRLRRMLSAVTMIFLKESPISRSERVSCSTLSASGILQADCI